MTALLASAMAMVAAYSGARILVPALRDTEHRPDVDAWHGVMGACMAVMLLVSLPGGISRAAFVLFAGGVLWCVVQLARSSPQGLYIRLGICCLTMLAMLGVTEGPAAAAGHTMPAMSGAVHGPPPAIFAAALVLAMGFVVAAAGRQLAVPGRAVGYRLGVVGEIVLAGAMAHMLLAMV